MIVGTMNTPPIKYLGAKDCEALLHEELKQLLISQKLTQLANKQAQSLVKKKSNTSQHKDSKTKSCSQNSPNHPKPIDKKFLEPTKDWNIETYDEKNKLDISKQIDRTHPLKKTNSQNQEKKPKTSPMVLIKNNLQDDRKIECEFSNISNSKNTSKINISKNQDKKTKATLIPLNENKLLDSNLSKYNNCKHSSNVKISQKHEKMTKVPSIASTKNDFCDLSKSRNFNVQKPSHSEVLIKSTSGSHKNSLPETNKNIRTKEFCLNHDQSNYDSHKKENFVSQCESINNSRNESGSSGNQYGKYDKFVFNTCSSSDSYKKENSSYAKPLIHLVACQYKQASYNEDFPHSNSDCYSNSSSATNNTDLKTNDFHPNSKQNHRKMKFIASNCRDSTDSYKKGNKKSAPCEKSHSANIRDTVHQNVKSKVVPEKLTYNPYSGTYFDSSKPYEESPTSSSNDHVPNLYGSGYFNRKHSHQEYPTRPKNSKVSDRYINWHTTMDSSRNQSIHRKNDWWGAKPNNSSKQLYSGKNNQFSKPHYWNNGPKDRSLQQFVYEENTSPSKDNQRSNYEVSSYSANDHKHPHFENDQSMISDKFTNQREMRPKFEVATNSKHNTSNNGYNNHLCEPRPFLRYNYKHDGQLEYLNYEKKNQHHNKTTYYGHYSAYNQSYPPSIRSPNYYDSGQAKYNKG